jgi:hypothetical protein
MRMSADLSGERGDLLGTLAMHRSLLRRTVRDLDDEQVARRTTVSELCLGGVIKHVASVEGRWARFIVEGPGAMGPMDEAAMEGHARSFIMLQGETLAGILKGYEEVAARTAQVVLALEDLGQSQELPPAPWFPPGTRWSARRVLLHIIGETAQHAGHADIIRESLDGAKSMA